MGKILIDIVGAGFGTFVAMTFYETFWPLKEIRKLPFNSGIIALIVINVITSVLLQNTVILIILTTILFFLLSFYYESKVTYKILLSLVMCGLMLMSEVLLSVVFMYILVIPIEQVQDTLLMYMVGVFTSKLVSLLLVYIIRAFIGRNKQETGGKFNLLMALLPIQSIILCVIVHGFSTYRNTMGYATLGIIAVSISLLLVFITMIILKNQLKALAFKKKYELSQIQLAMQIEHYQQLYKAMDEVKKIRHNIRDDLIAITGMLEKGMVQESQEFISTRYDYIHKTANIVDTNLPSVDAVISAKITKAADYNIEISYKSHIETALVIDQFDIASLIAAALDNAIEGVMRSNSTTDKNISLSLSNTQGYILIFVENYTAGPINKDFRTTKTDSENHGFGLLHMRTVAHKYDGDVSPQYDPDTGIFTLRILLKNK